MRRKWQPMPVFLPENPTHTWAFPEGLAVKNLLASTGDRSSIPRSRRSPGERNGNTLQYPCLGNPMDRAAGWATVHRVAKELNIT